MNLQKSKQQGFTLVELLIVIVVIAILAAISIVAYNGIQNRANNTTAKQTATQIRTKIEAYNTIKSHYPATGTNAQNLATILAEEKESELDDATKGKLADNATVTKEKPAYWSACTKSPATEPTGGTLTYWRHDGTETFSLGSC